MTAIEQYNALEGKELTRSQIRKIINLAKLEGAKEVENKLVGLLSANRGDNFHFDKVKKIKQIALAGEKQVSFETIDEAIEFFKDNAIRFVPGLNDDPPLKQSLQQFRNITSDFTDWEILEDDDFKQSFIEFMKRAVIHLSKKKSTVLKAEDKGYSGRKFEGKNYDIAKNLDIKEIADLVRTELKLEYPTYKISVRIERYSGGQSLSVDVSEIDFNPYTDDYVNLLNEDEAEANEFSEYKYHHRGNLYDKYMPKYGDVDQYSNEYLELEKNIKAIVDQYSMDDSDSMTDYFHVNFYSHIGIVIKDWEEKMFKNANWYSSEKKRSDMFNKQWDEKAKARNAKAKERRDTFKFAKGHVIQISVKWRGQKEPKLETGVI